MSEVYLNGEYVALENARISVLDRGFTFADAVYEVIPVYRGSVFRTREHLQRLRNSLEAIGIDCPYDDDRWRTIFNNLLQRNPCDGDCSLYVQVSRGVGDRDHLYDANLEPTVFVMARKFVQREWDEGVKAITHRDIRWEYCYIKSTSLLANVLLKQAARENDAKEAILVRDGFVTEGSSSNVFIVKDDIVITPDKDGSILAGVTRDLLVELLVKAGKKCEERKITLEEFEIAGEVWISSSTMGLAPVVKVDDRLIGNGRPGAMWQYSNDLFRDFRENRNNL